MMTFLQELSYTSLHPLPPLHGYLGSSQSQRLHPHRSGLSTRGSQKGIRRDMTFATMATGGSSIRDTFTASSKDSMRFILGGGKATDSMIARHGGADTELDILMMDSEVSSRRGMCDAQVIPPTNPQPPMETTKVTHLVVHSYLNCLDVSLTVNGFWLTSVTFCVRVLLSNKPPSFVTLLYHRSVLCLVFTIIPIILIKREMKQMHKHVINTGLNIFLKDPLNVQCWCFS